MLAVLLSGEFIVRVLMYMCIYVWEFGGEVKRSLASAERI